MTQWAQVFGDGFKAVLMFVYWVDTPLTPDPATFEFRDRWYLLMGVDLDEYRNADAAAVGQVGDGVAAGRGISAACPAD